MSLLTPSDVKERRFDVRHIRGGYDMEQVDSSMEEAEETIRLLAALLSSDRAAAAIDGGAK